MIFPTDGSLDLLAALVHLAATIVSVRRPHTRGDRANTPTDSHRQM